MQNRGQTLHRLITMLGEKHPRHSPRILTMMAETILDNGAFDTGLEEAESLQERRHIEKNHNGPIRQIVPQEVRIREIEQKHQNLYQPAAETPVVKPVPKKKVPKTSQNKIDQQDDLGRTKLHYAAYQGNLRECRRLVEKKGASIDIVDLEGLTPFQIAAREEHQDILYYLINEG